MKKIVINRSTVRTLTENETAGVQAGGSTTGLGGGKSTGSGTVTTNFAPMSGKCDSMYSCPGGQCGVQ